MEFIRKIADHPLLLLAQLLATYAIAGLAAYYALRGEMSWPTGQTEALVPSTRLVLLLLASLILSVNGKNTKK